jgi:hypothetical protein
MGRREAEQAAFRTWSVVGGVVPNSPTAADVRLLPATLPVHSPHHPTSSVKATLPPASHPHIYWLMRANFATIPKPSPAPFAQIAIKQLFYPIPDNRNSKILKSFQTTV